MQNRRQFLQAGLAASAACSVIPLAASAHSTGSAAGPGVPAAHITHLVYDRRFEAARALARTPPGPRRFGVDGDLTALWYEELGPRWSDPHLTIAGLTDANTFFCFQQLARPERRLLWQGEHAAGPDGTVQHALRLPLAAHARVQRALSAQEEWITALATLLTRVPRVGTLQPLQVSASSRLAPTPVRLFSWVLASRLPPTRAQVLL